MTVHSFSAMGPGVTAPCLLTKARHGLFHQQMRKIKRPASWMAKKAKRGFRGYPLATIAFYGPTAALATKVAISIVPDERNQPDRLERWFSEQGDIRHDHRVGEQIEAFLRQHNVRSVAMVDRILGCPHEEVVDYPEGESCPQCPYWAGRDRFTHERIH
jgi:hypothetical protein